MISRLMFDKFEGADFKHGNSFLKLLPRNTQIRNFLSKFRHFFFRKILQLDKSEGADFKYDNSFFKILSQKYPHEAFLVQNLGIFIISQNFTIRQIRGCGFQILQYSFQIPAQKYPNEGFLVPNLWILVLHQT